MIDEEVTLKKLEVFLAFMRLHSLSRVAEELGQSTVSVHRALHTLEEGLRCPLFRRRCRPLSRLPSTPSVP
jgi:LysR family malonate utilization transcriptional regulator